MLKIIIIIFWLSGSISILLAQDSTFTFKPDSTVISIMNSLKDIQSKLNNNETNKVFDLYFDVKVKWIHVSCGDTIQLDFFSKDSLKSYRKMLHVLTECRFSSIWKDSQERIRIIFSYGGDPFPIQKLKLKKSKKRPNQYFPSLPDDIHYSTAGGCGLIIKVVNGIIIIYEITESTSC